MSEKKDLSVTRAEALELLFGAWQPERKSEVVSLQDALGRVTAQAVYSRNTMPVYRTSQVDGIAVRSADFQSGLPDTLDWVKGIHYVQADTGDDFPDDFDTVIAVEDISYDGDGHVCFAEDFVFEKGDCVRGAGTAVRAGDLIAEAFVRLTPVHLAMLALGGVYQLEVLKMLKVVYIPTGNELINAGNKPERGQNIEANGLMVASFLRQWGAETICYPIIKDDPAELEQALDNALAGADMVLLNGGSSKGAEDFNAALLQKKAGLYRHGVKAIPGKPVAIAMIDGKPVINIPGPTLATFLAMDWCISGLVHHYYGLPAPKRPKIKVTLEKPLKKRQDYEFYVRLILNEQDGSYRGTPVGRDQSIPDSMLKPKALLIAPIGVPGYEAGEEVEAELLCGHEFI